MNKKSTRMWLGSKLNKTQVDLTKEYAIISIKKMHEAYSYDSLQRTAIGSELITCNYGECIFVIESDLVFVGSSYRRDVAATYFEEMTSSTFKIMYRTFTNYLSEKLKRA